MWEWIIGFWPLTIAFLVIEPFVLLGLFCMPNHLIVSSPARCRPRPDRLEYCDRTIAHDVCFVVPQLYAGWVRRLVQTVHARFHQSQINQDQLKVIWQKAKSLWQVHPIPRLYSPGGSKGLTVWLQFELHVLAEGLTLKSPLSPGVRDPQLTLCHWTRQVYL